jgi:hypothetical protein
MRVFYCHIEGFPDMEISARHYYSARNKALKIAKGRRLLSLVVKP